MQPCMCVFLCCAVVVLLCVHVSVCCLMFAGDDMGKAVKDADIVVVPAGVPRKPGMSRDDLFK